MNFHDIPLAVLTDSYKAGHYQMYPEANLMSAYGEFRRAMVPGDDRFVVFGVRHFVETYLHRRWTMEDLAKADAFYAGHNTGAGGEFTRYPYPRDLFEKFIRENDGYFPVRFQALRDGSVAHIHTPVFQITAEGEYSRLVTFLETVLTHLWFPCNVATLSRRTRDLIQRSFDRSVDKPHYLLESRLHDFGFRGTSSLESATLGGAAHLLNFRGSDTMSAAYYVQFHLNGGKPVAQSIPATEHSVMTAWPSEREAIENMIRYFGKGFFACVMDSYDYDHALTKVLPQIAQQKLDAGGFMTLRPDSGDPVAAVLAGLRAAEATFGADVNKAGYKVIRGAAVLQGDGVNYDAIGEVLDAAMDAGYSAASVVFGMGGGLLQKHNRDTMSFATKLSYIVYPDGSTRNVMKAPKADMEKASLPGIMEVKRNADGLPTVYPVGKGPADKEDLLAVWYDSRPVHPAPTESFDDMRSRVNREWEALPAQYDPRSTLIKVVQAETLAALRDEQPTDTATVTSTPKTGQAKKVRSKQKAKTGRSGRRSGVKA